MIPARVLKRFDKLVDLEMWEHPWAGRKVAERIVLDHNNKLRKYFYARF